MGSDCIGLGSELQGGIRAGGRGILHHHHPEGEEDGVTGGACSQLFPQQ